MGISKEESRELAKQLFVGYIQSGKISPYDTEDTYKFIMNKAINMAEKMSEKLEERYNVKKTNSRD